MKKLKPLLHRLSKVHTAMVTFLRVPDGMCKDSIWMMQDPRRCSKLSLLSSVEPSTVSSINLIRLVTLSTSVQCTEQRIEVQPTSLLDNSRLMRERVNHSSGLLQVLQCFSMLRVSVMR
jgi:hypothetical protein